MSLGAIFIGVGVAVVVGVYLALPFRAVGETVKEAGKEARAEARMERAIEQWVAQARTHRSSPEDVAPEPDQAEVMNFCPACGRRVGPDDRFCARCGRSLR